MNNSDPTIRSCRNHKCSLKGQPIFTGDFLNPKCGSCMSKLKPMRNGKGYTGPITQYDPDEGLTVSNITPTNNTSLPTPSAETKKETTHKIEYDSNLQKWICSCGDWFTTWHEKENHQNSRTRRHYTTWDSFKQLWACWCGFTDPDNVKARKHDDPMSNSQPIVQYGNPSRGLGGCSTWSEQDSTIKGCPIATKPVIYIPMLMYATWKWLAMAFNTEWLAYLKGKFVDTGDQVGWHVEDMYFPRQKAHGTHVEVINEREDIVAGTIGDVHSHVRMDAFFSNEDERHFNHDVHMVINADGKLVTSVRHKLNCGGFTRSAANIYYTSDDQMDGIVEELKAKLQSQNRRT